MYLFTLHNLHYIHFSRIIIKLISVCHINQVIAEVPYSEKFDVLKALMTNCDSSSMVNTFQVGYMIYKIEFIFWSSCYNGM